MDMKKIPKPRMEDERKQRREREKYERQQVQSATPEHSLFSEPIRVDAFDGDDDDIAAKLGKFDEARDYINLNTVGITKRPMPTNAVLPGIMPPSASASIRNGGGGSGGSGGSAPQQRLQMPPPAAASAANASASSASAGQQQLPHHYQQQQQQSHPPYIKQADNKPPYNGRGGYPGQPVKNDLRSSSGMAPPKGPPPPLQPPSSQSATSNSSSAAAAAATALQPPATTIMPNGRSASASSSGGGETTFLVPGATPLQNGRFPQPKSRPKAMQNDIQISSILKEMRHYQAPEEHITKIAPTPHNTIAADSYNLNGPNKYKYAFMKSPPSQRRPPSPISDLPDLPGLAGLPPLLMQSAPITPIGALPASPSSAAVASNPVPLTAAVTPLSPGLGGASSGMLASQGGVQPPPPPHAAQSISPASVNGQASVTAATALLRPKEPIKPWKTEKASPRLEKQNSTLENDLELSDSDDDRKRQNCSAVNSSESSQSDSSESGSEESERSHHSQLQTPLAANSLGATGGAAAPRSQSQSESAAKAKLMPQNHQTITASGNNTISSMLIGSGFGSAGSSSAYSGPSSTSSSNKTPSPSDSNKWNLSRYFKTTHTSSASASAAQQTPSEVSSAAAPASGATVNGSASAVSMPVAAAATVTPTAVAVMPSAMNMNSMNVSMNMPTMLPGGAEIILEVTPQPMKSEKLANGQGQGGGGVGDDDEDDDDDDDDDDDEDDDEADCDATKMGAEAFRHPVAAAAFGSRMLPGLSVTPVSPVLEIKKELSFDEPAASTTKPPAKHIKSEEDPYSSITGLSNLSDTNSSEADEPRAAGPPSFPMPRSSPAAGSKPPTLPNSLTVTPLPTTSPSTAGRKAAAPRTKRKKLKVPQQPLPSDSSDDEGAAAATAAAFQASVAVSKAHKLVPADCTVSVAAGATAPAVTKKGRGRPRKTASQSGNISSASSTAKGPTTPTTAAAKKAESTAAAAATTAKAPGRRLSRQNSSSATSTQGSTPTKAPTMASKAPAPAVIPPPRLEQQRHPAAATADSSDDSSSSSSGSSSKSSSSSSDSEEMASGAGSASSSDEDAAPPVTSSATNGKEQLLRSPATSQGRTPKAAATANTATIATTTNNKRKLSTDEAAGKKATAQQQQQPTVAKKGRPRLNAGVAPEAAAARKASSGSSSSSSEESSAEEGQISAESEEAGTVAPPQAALTAMQRTHPPPPQPMSSSCSSSSSGSGSSSSGDDHSDSDCKSNRKDKKLRRDKPKSDKNKLNTLTRIFTPKEGGAKKQGQVMIVEEPLSKEQQQQVAGMPKHVSPNAAGYKGSQENLAAAAAPSAGQYGGAAAAALPSSAQSPRLTPGHKKSPRNALPLAVAQRTPDRCPSSDERKLQSRIRTPTRTPPTRTPPTARTRTPTPTHPQQLSAKLASPAPSLVCRIDLSRLTHIPPEWHSNTYRLHAAAAATADRRSTTPSGGNHTPSSTTTAAGYGAGRTPIYDHESILNADLQAGSTQMRLRAGGGGGGSSTPRSLGSHTPTQLLASAGERDRELSRSRESLHFEGGKHGGATQRLDECTTNGRMSSRSTDGATTPKELLPPPAHLTPNGYRGCFSAGAVAGGQGSPSTAKLISPGSVKYEHNIKYEPDADPAAAYCQDSKYTKPPIKQEHLIMKHEIKGGAGDGESSPIESKGRRKRSSSASSSPYKEKKRKRDKGDDRERDGVSGGAAAVPGGNLKREMDQQMFPTNHDRLSEKAGGGQSGGASAKRQLNNNTNANNNNNTSPAHLMKPVAPPPSSQPQSQNSVSGSGSGAAAASSMSLIGGGDAANPSCSGEPGTSAEVQPKVIYRSYFERDDDALNKQFKNTGFLVEAVRRKHLADTEKKPFTQVTIYLEAVVYFLLSGAEMEEHRSSEEAAWKMYRETLALIKFISTKFKNLQDDEYTTKVLILSLRCQSLMSLKLFTLKRNFCRTISQSCNEFFNNNRNDIINGNTPSSISPSNSVWSQGSGSNTPPGRLVPQTIHSYLRQQNQFFNYLANSHELWDQADKLVRQGNHTDFFIALDHENGPLTLHSSMYEVFRYVQAGLNRLNDTRSTQ